MRYIERALEQALEKYLKRKEILAVVGPRQAGKTTIVEHLFEKLEHTHKVSFDDMDLLDLFQNDIKSFIDIHIKPFRYVFIDEIQYAKGSGKSLKFIFDTVPTKLFISGSSAADMAIQSLKFLVGRVLIFTLYTLSFKEFLRYKVPEMGEAALKGSKIVARQLQPYVEEYLSYGGYPEVVLADTAEEKAVLLKNIYNTYFLREIKEIIQLSDDFKLRELVKALALQIGSIINYQELSSLTGVSFPELKQNLNILEKTFICGLLRNFHTNKRQELRKSPKVYFVDIGFRNFVIKNFNKERPDRGALLENFVYSELIREEKELRYWRTKAKAEVDFVLEEKGEVIPIEVKSQPKITKSLQSFIMAYHPKIACLLSLHPDEDKKIGAIRIKNATLASISSLFL